MDDCITEEDHKKVIKQRNKKNAKIKTLTTEIKTLKEKNKQLDEKNKTLKEKNKQLDEKNKKLVVANNIFKQKIYVDNKEYFDDVKDNILFMFNELVDNKTRSLTPQIKIRSFIQKLIQKKILFVYNVKQQIYNLIGTKYKSNKDNLIKDVKTQIKNHLLGIYDSCKKPIILGCSKYHNCIELRF